MYRTKKPRLSAKCLLIGAAAGMSLLAGCTSSPAPITPPPGARAVPMNSGAYEAARPMRHRGAKRPL